MPILRQHRDEAAPLAIAAAILAAAAVRLWNLRGQVLGGDELHAVATALNRPLEWILTTYSLADYSIPLTAAIRLWLARGGALTEMGLRTPGLVCGAALVGLVGVAGRRALGGAFGARHAWLVAFAPGLVLYSRIVRSYAPMVLLAIGAVIAAWRWIETRSHRAALGYVVLAALATWFHLGAGPFVVAPLLFAAALRLDATRHPDAPTWREIGALGAAVAAAFGLFLVPARASLLHLVTGVRNAEQPSLATWGTVAKLQAGTPDAWLAIAIFTLAMLGLVSFHRARPRLAAYGATLVGAQIAGLLVLRPAYFEYSFILNRYLLPCSVVLLAWVAAGLGALAPSRPRAAVLATTALLAISLARGPFVAPAFLRGSFAHGNDAVSYEDGAQLRSDRALVPRFYETAVAEGARGAVVEAPWHAWWQFSRLFVADQAVHGKRVLVSGEIPGLRDPRIAFRNYVAPDAAALARADADWVVVHLDLEAEQARIRGLPGSDTFGEVPAATRTETWELLRGQAAEIAARLESAWGPAEVAEPGLRAWRLPRP